MEGGVPVDRELLVPDGAAILRLCESAPVRRLPCRYPLFSPHGPTDRLCVVVKGLCKLYAVREDGTERIVRFTRPWDILGLSTLVGWPPVHFAATVSESEVVFLSREQALRHIWHEPEVDRALVHVLMATIAQLCERTLLPSRRFGCAHHVARALAHLIRRSGLDVLRPPIALALTHQDLADFLCLHRVSVTRALGELGERGLVRSRPRCLEVLDPQGLAL